MSNLFEQAFVFSMCSFVLMFFCQNKACTHQNSTMSATRHPWQGPGTSASWTVQCWRDTCNHHKIPGPCQEWQCGSLLQNITFLFFSTKGTVACATAGAIHWKDKRMSSLLEQTFGFSMYPFVLLFFCLKTNTPTKNCTVPVTRHPWPGPGTLSSCAIQCRPG